LKPLLLSLFLMLSLNAFAETVSSTKSNQINVARIDKVVTLVDKAHIKVNVVVEDLGGSTDVGATQNVFFTLYSKGEMFSTDATFNLGPIIALKSAKRISGGIYQVNVIDGEMKPATLMINAIDAIMKLKSFTCEDFDCEASSNFSASINVAKK